MAETNTINETDILELLLRVKIAAEKRFNRSTLQELSVSQKLQTILQEYEEALSLAPSILNLQLAKIEFLLRELLRSLTPLSTTAKADETRNLAEISYYLDKLFFIINFEKNFRITLNQALSDQNQEVIEKISRASNELNEQVLKAKDITELLQSTYEKTSSDLQASNLEQLTKLQEETLKYRTDFETEAKEKLGKIDESVTAAEELKHYAQGKALSGFFADRAAEEKRSAANWTYLTWAFAITTLGAIGVIFYFQLNNFVQNQQADLSLLGTKVLFTATLGLVAKWTSKRANRHLADESKYHRLAINLKTIDSFIEKLKPESKDEILKAVALKTFTEINGNETATDFETASVLDVVKGVLTKDGK